MWFDRYLGKNTHKRKRNLIIVNHFFNILSVGKKYIALKNRDGSVKILFLFFLLLSAKVWGQMPLSGSLTKNEAKAAVLNNFSDSVFSLQLPFDVVWRLKCKEIEPFMKEALAIQEKEAALLKQILANKAQEKQKKAACRQNWFWFEGLAIEKKYLLSQFYYYIWDTQNVNPYPFRISDFTDSIPIVLFDYSKDMGWSEPLARETRVTSEYGIRRGRWHHGIDLSIEFGDPIQSVFDGVVRIAKHNRGGYGNYVLVRHDNGLETLYGHLSKYTVTPGEVVKAGQAIGYGGNTGRSTGKHLHFEVRYCGYAFDPKHLFDFSQKGGKLNFERFLLTPSHYKGIKKHLKGVYHRIRNGDSLWVISRRYNTSIRKICRLNGISKNTVLRVGKRLRVR